MKKPYIANYLEEVPLQQSAELFYDSKSQMNYIDNCFKIKAIEYNRGPQTTTLTETNENADTDYIYSGPETTIRTDSTENSDINYYCIETVEKKGINSLTISNSVSLGPDTTRQTFTSESADENQQVFFGPDTTIETRTNENADFD
ncbi:hypothetical protein KZO01_21960 [Kurthia zopfii]|uniref:Uncharacterized protein n=1 Tax=Kurthia zopfii TaxID=1650 RepID=A0A2U3A9U0_9BACL|nr:hypothetical protein [Kurthia zopfii]PWI21270.1 hypothetical protein DF281_13155 [Kurthia zopfii]TDR33934.1 hypothetical protein DFR61_1462 [Kurthia zopfii]STX09502.1 Uncharacterised protein [Kurthia zopfii]VEI06594.1 Uncharacterised protein [Kurthia zopfii]GEK31887.1 hypothetical protein KZO01_21960 [Kurthia zopfii]